MPKRDVLRPWMGMDNKEPDVVFATAGMGAVGTVDGVVRTVVSSPGASSGSARVALALALDVNIGASGRKGASERNIESSGFAARTRTSESDGRFGCALLTDMGESGWTTGATGTAVSSPGWLPAVMTRPTASTEDTAATSDLTPCAFM